MERNALAYTVGITVTEQRGAGGARRLRTRPVLVEVRAYVDEDEARRAELLVAVAEPEPRRASRPVESWYPSCGIDAAKRARWLDDVRQSKFGVALWPKRGRVQFSVLADEPCWIPDLRLAMLVALHNARTDDVDLDSRAIWFGGIPRGRPGLPPSGEEPPVDVLPQYGAHAAALATSRGVDVWGPDGPLLVPERTPGTATPLRPLPLTFATEVVAAFATRAAVRVAPEHVEVVTAWALHVQASSPLVERNGFLPVASVMARSSRAALRGAPPLPDVLPLSAMHRGPPLDPTVDGAYVPPTDGLWWQAALGVVQATDGDVLPPGLVGTFDPTAPIVVVSTSDTTSISAVYDTDNPWVLPSVETVALLRSTIPGTAPEAFARIARSFDVVQD